MESKGSEAEVINSECNRQKTRLTVRGEMGEESVANKSEELVLGDSIFSQALSPLHDFHSA